MAVNDLNDVSKKRTQLNKIDENWDLFECKNKIRIYLTTWRTLGLKRYFNDLSKCLFSPKIIIKECTKEVKIIF